MNKMTTEQRNSYLEAHMEVQKHMQHVSIQLNKTHSLAPLVNLQNHSAHQHIIHNSIQSSISQQSGSSMNMGNYAHSNTIKVPQITTSTIEGSFPVSEDGGLAYENGNRVLQSLSNWSTDIPANVPRPNLIPFIEPYIEGGSMHPASRLKALQQVQQASQTTRKQNPSKCKE